MEDRHRFSIRHVPISLVIDPLGGAGVEHVSDGDHPGLEADLVSPESVGISSPVELLVVAPYDRGDPVVQLTASQDREPVKGMELDLEKLHGVESSRFLQDPIRDSDLADVVEQCCGQQPLPKSRVVTLREVSGHLHHVPAHSVGVALGVWILGIDGFREEAQAGHHRLGLGSGRTGIGHRDPPI